MQVGKLICTVGFAGLSGACSYGHDGVDATSIRRNPHPVQIVQVSGTVPREFKVDAFRVIYATDSPLPFCNGLDLPDGGPFPLKSDIVIPASRNGDLVSVRVERDRYAPSLCRWKLDHVFAVVTSPENDKVETPITFGYLSLPSCGYKHRFFGCVDSEPGQASYAPLPAKDGNRLAKFVIRDSGYRAPSDYEPPRRAPNGVLIGPQTKIPSP